MQARGGPQLEEAGFESTKMVVRSRSQGATCDQTGDNFLRFFADWAAKKWPLRGSLKLEVGACNLASMTDGLSTLYRDLLGGSYDCVDRIVLNAYFRMGHDPGGFRVWWRALTGSDETLENAYLMRLAGRFSHRIRGYAKAQNIPVIDCPAGQRKHDLAEEYLAKTTVPRACFWSWSVGRRCGMSARSTRCCD